MMASKSSIALPPKGLKKLKRGKLPAEKMPGWALPVAARELLTIAEQYFAKGDERNAAIFINSVYAVADAIDASKVAQQDCRRSLQSPVMAPPPPLQSRS